MKKRLSIQLKVMALILALIIVTTVLNAFASFTISSTSLETEIKGSLNETTNYIEGTLDLFFKNYEDGMAILGDNQNIFSYLLKRQEIVDAQDAIQGYSKNHQEVQSVYISTERKEFFVWPKQEIPEGFDPTTTVWYQAAVNKKGVIWTDPYKDTGSGNLVVTVAKPVYTESGTLLGVIGADISLEQLTKMITSFTIGEKGYIILSDTKGNIIAHPQADKIGKPFDVDKLKEAALSGAKTGTFDYKSSNKNNYASYLTVERTGWKMFGTFEYSEVSDKTHVILNGAFLSSLVLILIAGVLAFLLTRPVINGIKSLSKDMLIIGNGDFTVRSNIGSRDEIGLLSETLNKMAAELGTIISNIKKLAMEVSASSNSLAASSEESTATADEVVRTIQEIVRVAEDQASNTEDGLKKTTQLSEKIQDVSKEIVRIAEMIGSSNELNEMGVNSVTVLKNASDASNAASEKVGAVIAEVDRSSGQIGVIVNTMTNIAGQTNLLALNASIEAARAGESGKGFAVVANEIRKLAEQSAAASNDIRRLINNIQSQSKNAVATMGETKAVVEAQNSAVFETKEVFDKISLTIEKLNREVAVINELNNSMVEKKDEILSTMESVSASAEQTSASTQQIAASTHEQLATADEVAKTAEQLNRVAQKLSKEVAKFKM